MNEILYDKIKYIRNTLMYSKFFKSTNKEEIKEYLLNCGFEENKEFEEAISIIIKCNEEEKNGNDHYFRDYLKETFSNMKPEDLSKLMEKFNEYGLIDENIVESVPDVRFLLDIFAQIPEMEKYSLVDMIDIKRVCEYIENNGASSFELERFYAVGSNYANINDFIENFKSERIKTELVLLNGGVFVPDSIKDHFYRAQMVKKCELKQELVPELLINEMEEYDTYREKIDSIETEEEKAEFISHINNNKMKEVFLQKLDKKENRNKVIESFDRYVDEDLKGLDELAQKMMIEYFEDTLGDKFTEEQRENLKLVMNSTDVAFSELSDNINGRAFFYDNRVILINERHKNNKNMIIGLLLHEYAHQLSYRNYYYTGKKHTFEIEEGMADLFSDSAINHYIDKHEEVLLDGKPIRISHPYEAYSGYNFEAAWPRTMLAGLESSGKDKEAMGEYFLGSQVRFAEMIFGEDNAKKRIVDEYGTVDLNTSYKELYYSSELDFSSINRNSIYYRRNFILPVFELENRLQGKADIIDRISSGNPYIAEQVSRLLFEDKGFYELSKEELKEFVELIHKQENPNTAKKSAVEEIWKYPGMELSRINKEEMDDISFDILDKLPLLFGTEQTYEPDYIVEDIIGTAIEKEKEKIRNGQDIEETRRKKEAIVERYRKLFPRIGDRNVYINDFIDDFEFECDRQEKESKSLDMDYE